MNKTSVLSNKYPEITLQDRSKLVSLPLARLQLEGLRQDFLREFYCYKYSELAFKHLKEKQFLKLNLLSKPRT